MFNFKIHAKKAEMQKKGIRKQLFKNCKLPKDVSFLGGAISSISFGAFVLFDFFDLDFRLFFGFDFSA